MYRALRGIARFGIAYLETPFSSSSSNFFSHTPPLSAANTHSNDWVGSSFRGCTRSECVGLGSNYTRAQFKRGLIQQTVAEPIRMKRLSGSDTGIIEVTLDRPEAVNALGNDSLKSLQGILETLNVDSSAHVVILCSALPKVFCAGADLKERRKMSASEVKVFVNTLRSTFSLLEALSAPTIAVIEGVAFGGGLELSLCCDLRVCGDAATFAMPETGLAIIPGAGGTQRLPRLIGRSQAKDLIFTGRKVDGKQAFSMGLVDYCVAKGDAYSKALEIARDINAKGPLAIKMAKVAIDRGSEVDTCSGMFIEESCYAEVLNSEDRLEGLAAFAEKRKPTYTGN